MRKLLLSITILLAAILADAQPKAPKTYRNFPLVAGVQFHSLSQPLKDLKSAFSNTGVFAGTELSLNGKSTWVQQFTVGWQNNRDAGNGIMLYTQTAWRPNIGAGFYTEVKAGIGSFYNSHPTHSYRSENGAWIKEKRSGQWMTMIPVGVSAGYQRYAPTPFIAPFISYQVFAAGKYNPSAPIITNQLIQAGSRIYF